MTRTCYFCEKLSPYDCKKHLDVSYLPNQYEYEARKCDTFTPNADWLEYIKLLDDQIAFREKTVNDLYERDCRIEELKKENEELKRKIESYKYEREKLHGYLAKREVKP